MKVKFSFLAFLMIVLVAPVAFMACSDDDDAGSDPIPEELLGKWRQVSQVYSNCAIEEENGTVEYECTDSDCVTVEFFDDGTFEYIILEGGIEDVTEGTFRINGNKITLCPNDGDCGTDTFSVDEETLSAMWTDEGCTVSDTYIRYIILQ